MRKSLTMVLFLVGLAPAIPAIAHHSGAMFDRSKTVTLEGVVKEYKYAAPHTWIQVVIQQGGAPVTWAVEGGERHALAPGDLVHIPAKTPHNFLVAKGKHITYVLVKFPAP